MNKLQKQYHIFHIVRIVAIFGISVLLSIGAFISIDMPRGAPIDDIEWSVTLNFNETDGKIDHVVFGEALDANDGPPIDSYDQPKPPAPMPPYIRVWFNDNLPEPYNLLLKDYRRYPDTYKIWNLSIQWVPYGNATSTSVTMSWDINEVDDSEYPIVILYDHEGNPLKNMTTQNSYSFICPAATPQNFKIICEGLNNPPYEPNNPDPENGAPDVDINADLSWIGGDPDGDPVTYDVYFGTSSPPTLAVSNQSTTTHDHGVFDYETTYYWKIVAWDNHSASTEGPIWSFTTKASSNGGPPNGGSDEQENIPPTADASASETLGIVDSPITFDGTRSLDQDGYIKNWSWDFGDGNQNNGEIVTHAYVKSSTYNVTLTVTDNLDATDRDSITVFIGIANTPPSKPTITGPTSGTKNTEYTYNATASDEDNDMIQYHFDWDDDTSNTTAFLPNGTTATQTHTWTAAGKYTISVQVYDNQTPSDTTRYTVLIDAHIVDDIGYITDDDADGTYDTFHDTDLETNLGQDEDGKYLIDIDGDGEWDYIYNQTTGTTTPFTEETIDEVPWAVIALIAVALAIISLIVYFYKKGYF